MFPWQGGGAPAQQVERAGHIPTHLHTLSAAGNGQIMDGFRPLRGVTGLARLWQLALPSHLKCWCLRVEWNRQLPKGQSHNSSLPHCAPGRALLLRVTRCAMPAHNQASPERRVLHVTNGWPKRSASPSSQPGQEPCPVRGPQAAHSTHLLTSVPHTTSTIPPNSFTCHLQENCPQLPLFYKLASNRVVSWCHSSPRFCWFMAHMADLITT